MEEICLDLAEIKQEPPEEVQKAVKASASEINRYPEGDYGELKREFAEYVGVGEDQLSFSNGLGEMIDTVTAIWGGQNFVPVPTFSQFSEASRRRDQETQEVSMMVNESYKLDRDKINFGSDLIWLCTPNNPTGTEIPREKVKYVCDNASGLVVVDECYADFTGNSYVDMVEEYGNLVVLRSFSKSFGLAGLRLGAAISSKENIEKVEEYMQPFNVSRVAAEAGKAALRNREKYREMRQEVIEVGKDFAQYLEDRGLETGEVNGNFVLVKFDDREEAEKYFRGLQRLNVSVFPGWNEEFSGLGGRFLRFTIGTREQMEEVENRFKVLEQKLIQEE